jgi:hypothetical protein
MSTPFAQNATVFGFRPTPDGKLTLTSTDFPFLENTETSEAFGGTRPPKGKSLLNQRNKEEFGG